MTIAIVTMVAYSLIASVRADKDDSYYIAGTGNPNKNEKMYWKDAENIFQDLNQFSTLYVEFHNCAWSWMMMSEQDNDIDENDYWYMGKIPPMGANVAYSLYGSLAGEDFSGCSTDTFINSFYTNTGFTNFARAMSYAGLSGFSSYSYDDSSSSSYTGSCSGGYGVGCDFSNGFAVHTYSGDECNPANYTGVKDKLSSLNSAMQSAKCIQVFDANSYRGSPYGTALELLAYSHSCFYQDFFSPDGVCPDPYGKLLYYQQQFYNGIQESKKQDPYQVSRRKTLYNQEIRYGKIMTLAGMGLAALACVIFVYDCVVACCMPKGDLPGKYVPRQDDFIIQKRSEEFENYPTHWEMSDTSCENYVTMSTETYSPPAAVAMPLLSQIAASSENSPPTVTSTLIPLPQGASKPMAGPTFEAAVGSTLAHQLNVDSTIEVSSQIVGPTAVQPPEVTLAAILPAHQGYKMPANIVNEGDSVTVHSPRCSVLKVAVPAKEVTTDTTKIECLPVRICPLSTFVKNAETKEESTNTKKPVEASLESSPPTVVLAKTVEPKGNNTTKPCTLVISCPLAPFVVSPNQFALMETLSVPKICKNPKPSKATSHPPHCESPTKNTVDETLAGPEVNETHKPSTEIASSPPNGEKKMLAEAIIPEDALCEETSSSIGHSDIASILPRFAENCGSSSEYAPHSDASVYFVDEDVAGQELDGSSEDENGPKMQDGSTLVSKEEIVQTKNIQGTSISGNFSATEVEVAEDRVKKIDLTGNDEKLSSVSPLEKAAATSTTAEEEEAQEAQKRDETSSKWFDFRFSS